MLGPLITQPVVFYLCLRASHFAKCSSKKKLCKTYYVLKICTNTFFKIQSLYGSRFLLAHTGWNCRRAGSEISVGLEMPSLTQKLSTEYPSKAMRTASPLESPPKYSLTSKLLVSLSSHARGPVSQKDLEAAHANLGFTDGPNSIYKPSAAGRKNSIGVKGQKLKREAISKVSPPGETPQTPFF